MKAKNIPKRMCLVCRSLKPRNELVRMVWQKDRGIFWDEEYSLAGKGLYLCREAPCLIEFTRARRFKRSFVRHLDSGCLERLKEVVG